MSKLKISLTLIIATIVTACGFHLRGLSGDTYKFPFQKVYIECNGVAICQNLISSIKLQDLSTIESNPQNAEVTIKLSHEQTSRDIQSMNSVGRITAYLLNYQAEAQVWQHGEQIGNTLNLASQAVMQYNDSTIIGDTQEEANFWDQLHQNANNQLIRRLIHFSYQNYSLNETESK